MDDLHSAWRWASPRALVESWKTFNWKFWKNDGMRNADENKELDPHYLEMLKVSHLVTACPEATLTKKSIRMHQIAGIS